MIVSNGSTYNVTEPAQYWLNLPLIMKAADATPPPPVTSGNVAISSIFYDGSGTTEPDEYVVIQNNDTRQIQLQNWTLRDTGNHTYTIPQFRNAARPRSAVSTPTRVIPSIAVSITAAALQYGTIPEIVPT